MIGKVQLDSFHGLGIRAGDVFADAFSYEPSTVGSSQLGEPSFLLKDCPSSLLTGTTVGAGRPSPTFNNTTNNNNQGSSPMRSITPGLQQQQPSSSSRYKTEMCRPYQEHGTCKYGEKCQFAHGESELRNVQRHPKYKTDMCRTYHSVGFCPYGPRCHFIHSLDEIRAGAGCSSNAGSPDKHRGAVNGAGGIKQLPMFGGNKDTTWSNFSACDNSSSPAPLLLNQLNTNNIYQFGSGRSGSLSSSSDGESNSSGSPTSCSPPPDSLCTSPIDVSRSLRLPIFNRLA